MTGTTKRRRRRKKNPNPTPPKDQDFIQSTSVQLTNGLVITGTYLGPATKLDTIRKYVNDTLSRHGENHILVGDLNARHTAWDKATNERGSLLMEMIKSTPRTHIVAANRPSYSKALRKEDGRIVMAQSNPDIAIVRTQQASAFVDDRDWGGVSDHRPVYFEIKATLKLKELRRRVAKSLFFSQAAIKEAQTEYEEGIDGLMDKLDKCREGQEEKAVQDVYTAVEHFITNPWERIVQRRPPKKPPWWNRNIGTAQQRRRYLAKKWHVAKKEAGRWMDTDLCAEAKEAHRKLEEQQKATRRLCRQAQAKLAQTTKERLKQAGLTDQSRAINKDRRGKALRQAEAARTGAQLIPADFTTYMGSQQGKHAPIKAGPFKFDSRKFRRRMKRAIRAMQKNKAVGVDNVHSEMLQVSPALFAKLLTKVWQVVGDTKFVPETWTRGIMVPLHKKGVFNQPENYRPLCMLSHVRKAIERAVVDELDEIVTPDRMQFGFQRAINTLQAAVDVAAILSQAAEYLVAVLDLTKAYDKVVRELLIQKLENMGLPQDLVNQIVVFLVPLLVQTAGDVTRTTALLTTGLTQGGSASPALFRLFIDDIAIALRKAQGQDSEKKESIHDPAKLVADDVIIMAKSDHELQSLLDACTNWALTNCLEWKPPKCAVIAKRTPTRETKQFTLSGQGIPIKDEARYLGILITTEGFTKAADSELEGKCVAACAATINQPFFDSDLPSGTLRTLYRTNVRSIINYGLMLTKDITKMEALDRKLLSTYFKPLVQHKRKIADRLIDRLCLRLRLPSLAMDLECNIKNWLSKLRYRTNLGLNKKVRQHARDTLSAVQKLHPDVQLSKYYTSRGGNKHHILLEAFKKWNIDLAPAKRSSRVVDRVTKSTIEDDVLDSPLLSAEEKCSGYRYVVYRFPASAKLSPQEQEDLRLIMKQDLTKSERTRVIKTLKSVHARDERKRKEDIAAEALLKLASE